MYYLKNKLLFLLVFLFQYGYSQVYPSVNITAYDGLPNNEIMSLYKDSRGIVWAGTQNGVSAILNNEIKNFNKENGLAHNTCWAIAEDANHNMWFGSYGGGLTKFDGKKFLIIDKKKGLIDNHVRKILSFKDKIYIGTDNGLSVVDIKTNKINSYISKGIKDRLQVTGIFEYKKEIYIQTFNTGLWKLDVYNKFSNVLNHIGPEKISVFLDNEIIYSSDGNPYINQGMQKININAFFKNKIENRFGNTYFWDFVKDKRGLVYGAGCGVEHPTGGFFMISDESIKNLNQNFEIESKDIWCLSYDKKNDFLFAGSLGNGLYKLNLSGNIVFNGNSEENLKNPVIGIEQFFDFQVILYKDKIQFSSGGISKIYTKTSLKKLIDKAVYDNVRDFDVRSMKIHNKQLWVQTSKGLFVFDKNANIISHYPNIYNQFFDFSKDGRFIISPKPYEGTFTYDLENNLKEKYFDYSKNTPVDIFSIITVADKTFLTSISTGLFEFNNRSNNFFSYYNNKKWEERELKTSTKNSKNQLIVANTFGDIFILDVVNKFKVISKIKKEEIVGNSISFLETYKDYLIVGTEKGVNLYKNGKVQLIDEEQGIKNKIFTSSKIIGSKLLIGTNLGYYTINLDEYLKINNTSTNINITRLEVNYEPYAISSFRWFRYDNQTPLELSYNQNTLFIGFSPQDHPYPNKLLYRYKVDGLENNKWSEWSKDRNILLPYLPSGNFNIVLEIKDLYTGDITKKSILSFAINPPFWFTWWFILGILFLIGIIVFLVYRRRIEIIKDRERAKNQVQKRIAETKIEALQSQMNPHFIFNALNSVQNYIIDNHSDTALMYLGEFSKLIRQTLENSAKIKVSLEEEIDYIERYIQLENMRREQKVIVKVVISDEIDQSETFVPPMIIQPFVENVFVHAFDYQALNPELLISFYSESDSVLVCEIKDNGKGFSPNTSKIHKSKGIKLVKERLGLLQNLNDNTIEISSNNTIGTKVLIRFSL